MQFSVADALGTSDIFLAFQENVARAARAERPVLVLGERGTGKELAAQRLHYLSPRWEGPLVTVLCPALSPTLLESELFGHEAGAFTGARGRHEGYFERANRGTLFLDEVADMPLPVQDKLLRVLEYGEFERVGGNAPVRVDVRIVAAANRDLPRLAAEGKFRADLLDRLAFDVLHVHPCANGERTGCCWPGILPRAWPPSWISAGRDPLPVLICVLGRKPCGRWRNMPGRAMCAN